MNLHNTLKSLQDIALEVAKEVERQQFFLRNEVAKIAPEYLNEYDTLMKDVFAGDKNTKDVAEWWQKFHKATQKKNKDGLNTK